MLKTLLITVLTLLLFCLPVQAAPLGCAHWHCCKHHCHKHVASQTDYNKRFSVWEVIVTPRADWNEKKFRRHCVENKWGIWVDGHKAKFYDIKVFEDSKGERKVRYIFVVPGWHKD